MIRRSCDFANEIADLLQDLVAACLRGFARGNLRKKEESRSYGGSCMTLQHEFTEYVVTRPLRSRRSNGGYDQGDSSSLWTAMAKREVAIYRLLTFTQLSGFENVRYELATSGI